MRHEGDSTQDYLDVVETMIVALDAEGGITTINRKGCELFGRTADELVGQCWFSFCLPQPEGVETVFPLFRRLIAGEIEVAEYVEKAILTHSGEERLIEWHNALLRDDHGRIVGTLSSGNDVTERRQIAEALYASQQLVEGILDAIPVRVFWKDLNLAYLGCNAAFAADAGVSDPKNVIGKDDYEMVWRDQAESYRAADRRVIDSGRAEILIEEPQTTPEGETITLLTSKVPLRDASGAICGVLGTYTDITERSRMEEALGESEDRFRALFERGSFGVAVVNVPEWEFMEANPALCRTLGYTVDELRGMTFAEVTHPDDRSRDVLEVELLRTGVIPEYRTEKRYLKKNGDTVWGELAASLVRDADGRPLYALAMIHDVTARKRAEAERAKLQVQLHEARKMESVGRLAGGVAHDFNNMLGVILGLVELAIEDVDPAQPLHADLIQIHAAAAHSAKLTGQLLAFARRQPVAPEVLDLNDAVANTLDLLRRLVGTDVALEWAPAAELWPVSVDPSQIDQMLADLCLNARNAITGVGAVRIATGNSTLDADYCATHPGCVPGAYVRLAVSDDGCGMDVEVLSHIFEPFFTTRPTGQGTGLGLATVYGAVKQNRGFIDVVSEPQRGTTFTIYLPRHVGRAQARAGGGTYDVQVV